MDQTDGLGCGQIGGGGGGGNSFSENYDPKNIIAPDSPPASRPHERRQGGRAKMPGQLPITTTAVLGAPRQWLDEGSANKCRSVSAAVSEPTMAKGEIDGCP